MKTDYKEILLADEARTLLKKGINRLAEAVLVTMGPEGRTVIIPDENAKPKVTKDGVSVAKAIGFEDPIQNVGATLIKEVAQKTVNEAGDGTTTSICLANAFINAGFSYIQTGKSPSEVVKALEKLEELVSEHLFTGVKEVKGDDIQKVASIAANNDTTIGSAIQQAFEHSTVVKVERGHEKNHVIKLIDGAELNTGILDFAFINDAASQSISYKNGRILLVDGHLTNLSPYSRAIESLEPNTPLIIVCDEVSPQITKILKDNYNKGALIIGIIKSPGYAQHRKNLMGDLKILTSCDKSHGAVMGSFKSIKATSDKTIISFHDTKRVEENIVNLKTLLKNTHEEHSKELLQQRINLYTGKVAVIKVGGNSDVEIGETYDRVEDAVLATRCAIEQGVVEGAGYHLRDIGIKLDKEHPRLFQECLREPAWQIVDNGWKGTKGSLFEQGIIDPVKVVYTAFYNAASVAKTVLSVEAIIQ